MANPNAKPPKKRKASAYSRKIRGGNSKRTSFDYAGARDALGLPPSANAQQVGCSIAPAIRNTKANPSPLKEVVKARLAEELSNNELLSRGIEKAERDVIQKSKQINKLKQKLQDLSQALQAEKKKSRATIAGLLDDAEQIMSQACSIESEADQKLKQMMNDAEVKVSRATELSQRKVEEERRKCDEKVIQARGKILEERSKCSEKVVAIKMKCVAIKMKCEAQLESVKLKHAEQLEKVVSENERAKLKLESVKLKHAEQLKKVVSENERVKLKHAEQLEKVVSENESAASIAESRYSKKLQSLKDRLNASLQELCDEKAKWKIKLEQANAAMFKAKDEVYLQKCKLRSMVQQHLEELKESEEILKGYIFSLEEDNQELRQMLKKAASEKNSANRSARRAKKLAHDRLLKLCQERFRRQEAEDEAITMSKLSKTASKILEEYKVMIEETQERKKLMQKEWKDEEERRRIGGRKSWPVWVVQLIKRLS